VHSGNSIARFRSR